VQMPSPAGYIPPCMPLVVMMMKNAQPSLVRSGYPGIKKNFLMTGGSCLNSSMVVCACLRVVLKIKINFCCGLCFVQLEQRGGEIKWTQGMEKRRAVLMKMLDERIRTSSHVDDDDDKSNRKWWNRREESREGLERQALSARIACSTSAMHAPCFVEHHPSLTRLMR
jgi:hypothetical protein